MHASMAVECPVCLDYVVQARVASCGHAYCAPCLAKAAEASSACPMCRAPLGAESYPCFALDGAAEASAAGAGLQEDYALRREASRLAMVQERALPNAVELMLRSELPEARVVALGDIYTELLAGQPERDPQPSFVELLAASAGRVAQKSESLVAWLILALLSQRLRRRACLDTPAVARAAAAALTAPERQQQVVHAVERVVISVCSQQHSPVLGALLDDDAVAAAVVEASPECVVWMALTCASARDAVVRVGAQSALFAHAERTKHVLFEELLDTFLASHAREAAPAVARLLRDCGLAVLPTVKVLVRRHGGALARAVARGSHAALLGQCVACDDAAAVHCLGLLDNLLREAAHAHPDLTELAAHLVRRPASTGALRECAYCYVSATAASCAACAERVWQLSGSAAAVLALSACSPRRTLAASLVAHEALLAPRKADLAAAVAGVRFDADDVGALALAEALGKTPTGRAVLLEDASAVAQLSTCVRDEAQRYGRSAALEALRACAGADARAFASAMRRVPEAR